MALRDKIRANAEPFLDAGEKVEATILAQTFNPFLALLYQPLILFGKPYRAIVVTDKRILVFRTWGFRLSTLGKVSAELPRETQVGPAHGMWYRTKALGRPLYINTRYHKDVAAADDALSGGHASSEH